MKSSILAVGSIAALLGLTTAQSSGSEGNCTIFNWNNRPGYLQNDTAVRISGASTCPERNNETYVCPIVADGDWQILWTYNISNVLPADSDIYRTFDNFLHSIILQSVNSSLNGDGWNVSLIGAIDTTQQLSPGTSGYINFTPFLRCFEGTMSNCTGGIEDGIAIQACAPVYHTVDETTAFPILDGIYEIEEIPQANVTQYRDPFSSQSRGGAGQTAGRISGIMMGAGLMTALIAAWL